MPAGHLGTKRMGELAELAFMYRAASEGIGVARPYGDSHPYDFLVQHGRRLFRVQVKSCFSSSRAHARGYPIRVGRNTRFGTVSYSPEEIDFIAAFVASYRVWYVIPVDALENRTSINLYPRGKRRKGAAFYETYREAWHLLKEPEAAKIGGTTENVRKLDLLPVLDPGLEVSGESQ